MDPPSIVFRSTTACIGPASPGHMLVKASANACLYAPLSATMTLPSQHRQCRMGEWFRRTQHHHLAFMRYIPLDAPARNLRRDKPLCSMRV